MLNDKHYQDGGLDTHAAFIAAQPTPLIWKIIEALTSRLRPQPAAQAQESEQAHAGSASIYKSVRLR